MTFTEIYNVEATEPFDFDLTAKIFGNGDPQIRAYKNNVFSQALKLDTQLALVKVTSNGNIEIPKLTIEIDANHPVTLQDKRKAKDIIKFIFNLDFDLASFYMEIKNDPVMTKIANQLYGLRNPTTPTVFESLVDSIIEQQISIKVAIAIEEKLAKKLGDHLNVNGKTYFTFPTAKTLADASVDEIRQVGLSRRKAEYIQGAAEQIEAGKLDLERIKNLKNAEKIISELDLVRGIGVWTAELTMLRGMKRLDALPADDLGIRRVISTYYCGGRPIKAGEARQIAEAWGRFKGLAAFYLIMAEIRGVSI